MEQQKLKEKKVAVLIDNGFERVELESPVEKLRQAGATVEIISNKDKVKAWEVDDWGKEVKVDKMVDQADVHEYDALLLPGGVMNPDYLRIDQKAIDFVKYFIGTQKPVAAICHGPWTLVETGMVKGRKLTSYPSLKTDLKNAGAEWVDREVVVDGNLITSRNPDDLPAFNEKVLEMFSSVGVSVSDDLNSGSTQDSELKRQVTDTMHKKGHIQVEDGNDRFMTRDDELKHRYEK
ncbi:type 1 glutamine amidotransferase domain-containing protein [Cytophagaceae bacterium ABcell3]|nr:type 1 glutamine amidotransferase domain-containing protein [Cytophagaceae bacterium ABcell3]